MVDKNTALSDFGFERVVCHFNLTQAQQAEHTAMLAVFREFVANICTFSEAAGSRAQAAAMTIQKVEAAYRLFTLHADDFFKDHENYNRDALALAVIARDTLFDANIDAQSFGGGTNVRTFEKAQRICEDCCAIKGDEHFDDYTFSPESLFLLPVEALEDLSYLELHFTGWSLEELRDKQADGFSLYKKHLRPDTTIGAELSERIRIVEEKISAYIDAQPRDDAPKPVSYGEVIAFPPPKQ